MPIPAAAAMASLVFFQRVAPGMIISPAASRGLIPFRIELMARDNADFCGSTFQLMYFPRLYCFGGVDLDAVAKYFFRNLGF